MARNVSTTPAFSPRPGLAPGALLYALGVMACVALQLELPNEGRSGLDLELLALWAMLSAVLGAIQCAGVGFELASAFWLRRAVLRLQRSGRKCKMPHLPGRVRGEMYFGYLVLGGTGIALQLPAIALVAR